MGLWGRLDFRTSGGRRGLVSSIGCDLVESRVGKGRRTYRAWVSRRPEEEEEVVV